VYLSSSYAGNINMKIVVQASLGLKAKSYFKKG
jgi:hypothetical protein